MDDTNPTSPAADDTAADAAFAPPAEGEDQPIIDDSSIEELLKQATFDDPGNSSAPAAPVASVSVAAEPEDDLPSLDLQEFDRQESGGAPSSLDLLRDVEMNVKIELGRSRMLVEDVLKLAEGSVVELDKLAGDPVDVFVNDRLVARGEVLVLNDMFCVRINEIVAGVREEGL